MKPPSAHDPGALKSAPWSVGSGPWTVFRAHDTRDTASRIMDHAPWPLGNGPWCVTEVLMAAQFEYDGGGFEVYLGNVG